MSKIEATKTIIETESDWAIIPFDESADDNRWAQLTEEINELEKKAVSTEAIYGAMILDEDLPLPAPNIHSGQTEDDQLSRIEAF